VELPGSDPLQIAVVVKRGDPDEGCGKPPDHPLRDIQRIFRGE